MSDVKSEKQVEFGSNEATPVDGAIADPFIWNSAKPTEKVNLNHEVQSIADLELEDQFTRMFEARAWQAGKTDTPEDSKLNTAEAWQKCYTLTEKFDQGACDAWKAEVDNLLIFAGLFSATVTGFTLDSYKRLQSQPLDTTTELLTFISLQLGSISNPVISTTAQLGTFKPPTFHPTSSRVRINVLWYISLTLSLSTVLIGTQCLQWLREYKRDGALSHKDAIALRQMRYEGILGWHVPQIFRFLPLLLQSAVILFFVGLIDLLWTLNTLVAACMTAVISVVMLFMIWTTVLPGLQLVFTRDPQLRVSQCPYKSPQSWLFLRTATIFWLGPWNIVQRLSKRNIRLARWMSANNLHYPIFARRLQSTLAASSWMSYDLIWREYRDAHQVNVATGEPKYVEDSGDISNGLQWLNDNLSQTLDAVQNIHICLRNLKLRAASRVLRNLHAVLPEASEDVQHFRDLISHNPRASPHAVSALYLYLHKSRFPNLMTPFIVHAVRFFNSAKLTKERARRMHNIMAELLMDVPKLHSFTDHGEEFRFQMLLSFKRFFPKNPLSLHSSGQIWTSIMKMLSKSEINLLASPSSYTKLRESVVLATALLDMFEKEVKLNLDDPLRLGCLILHCSNGLNEMSDYYLVRQSFRVPEERHLVQKALSLVSVLRDMIVHYESWPPDVDYPSKSTIQHWLQNCEYRFSDVEKAMYEHVHMQPKSD